jgi:hypothetical protein
MRIIDCDQGSVEWYRARLGKPTASMFDKIITPEGKVSGQAQTYAYRLVAERLLNDSMDSQLDRVEWTEHGKIAEPMAVQQFEFGNDVELERVGFITTDDGRIGCSPDRLIKGDHGQMVEIKSPSPWVHLGYLLDGPGKKYKPQIQGQILVGDFDKHWFYSWQARMPPAQWLSARDDKYIAALATLLDLFCDDVQRKYERALTLGAYVTAYEPSTPFDQEYGGEAGSPPLQIVLPD